MLLTFHYLIFPFSELFSALERLGTDMPGHCDRSFMPCKCQSQPAERGEPTGGWNQSLGHRGEHHHPWEHAGELECLGKGPRQSAGTQSTAEGRERQEKTLFVKC